MAIRIQRVRILSIAGIEDSFCIIVKSGLSGFFFVNKVGVDSLCEGSFT
jgi:hypothetical protein